jgi:hypothetical protein
MPVKAAFLDAQKLRQVKKGKKNIRSEARGTF